MNVVFISKNENSKSIEYMINYLNYNKYKLFLISPEAEKSKYLLNKINDNFFLNKQNISNLFKKYNFNGRVGWYFQQFLKYKIVLDIEGEDFLIIDGDTICSSNLIRKNLLCYTGKQKYLSYYNFYKILFPEHKLSNLSFITNQMYFKKEYLKIMLKEIEEKYSMSWIEVFIKLLSKKNAVMFSEYQTYAEYIINNNLDYELKKIKIFRRMDLIEDFISPVQALKHYDILSYEYHHKSSFFIKFRMLLYYLIKRNVG